MDRLRSRRFAGLLFCLLLLTVMRPRGAAQAGRDVTLSGRLMVVWPEAPSPGAGRPRVVLTTDAGELILLDVDRTIGESPAALQSLNGARVALRGVSAAPAASLTAPPAVRVTDLRVDTLSVSTRPGVKVTPRVRMAYLVPSDRTFRADYLEAIRAAVSNNRDWYREQMGGRKTFTLAEPVVEVYQLKHPADWYRQNTTATDLDFFMNVVSDGFAAGGGGAQSPDAWAFFIDASSGCTQSRRSAGGAVAVFGAADLHALAGETSAGECGGESAPDARPMGVLAHELGHMFGLPHPAVCAADMNFCAPSALMALGSRAFPVAQLFAEETAVLDSSPFFAATVQAPFGVFDTPTDLTSVAGEVAVTGWALGDPAIAEVNIYRARIGTTEPTGANGLVFIGRATFVPGARPDVAALYPTLPQKDRAGWGYNLLSNLLPVPAANAPITIQAIAKNSDGVEVSLGTKRIVLANATSQKPFGTIDTPGQGETVSGTITNFGWALTPQPNLIPIDGSTIDVMVDNVLKGHPVYNNNRADIATTFPGLRNSNGGVGYFSLDTRTLADGLHTINWNVRDSAGNSAGLGSRYFTVNNGETILTTMSGNISPGGGRITIPNVARIELLENTARPALAVTMQQVQSTTDQAALAGYVQQTGLAGAVADPNEIRVVSSAPIPDSVGMVVTVPPTVTSAVGSNPTMQPELFAQVPGGNANEDEPTYIPLNAEFNTATGELSAPLPGSAFEDDRAAAALRGVHAATTPSYSSKIIVGVRRSGARGIPLTATVTQPASTSFTAGARDTVSLAASLNIKVPGTLKNPTRYGGPTTPEVTGAFVNPGHRGVDLRSADPDPITAAADGVISPMFFDSVPGVARCNANLPRGGGWSIRITHDDGSITSYSHLKAGSQLVSSGRVTAGTAIAVADQSGGACGPHLHLGYIVDNVRVNPLPFIQTDATAFTASYLAQLSVVAVVNGTKIEGSRKRVTSKTFQYTSSVDLSALNLQPGVAIPFTMNLETDDGQSTPFYSGKMQITATALRVVLSWDKNNTDVDLHVRDSAGHEAYYGNTTAIPGGFLDHDDTDGFGPEVFTLQTMAANTTYTVFLHYYSDHGQGSTTSHVSVYVNNALVTDKSVLLTTNQQSTIGVYNSTGAIGFTTAPALRIENLPPKGDLPPKKEEDPR